MKRILSVLFLGLFSLSLASAWAAKTHKVEALPVASAPLLTLSDFRHADASYDGDRVIVRVTLGDVAAVRVQKWSADHVGERLALLIDDHLLAAPVMRVPITGASLQLDALSKADADVFVAAVNAR